MGRFIDNLLTRQHAWRQTRSPEYELRGLDGALALIWLYHHQIAGDPVVTPELEEFIDVCRPGIEAERIWFGRTHCGGCFQRFKLENTATCIECHRTLCWRCSVHSMSKPGAEITTTGPGCGGEMY